MNSKFYLKLILILILIFTKALQSQSQQDVSQDKFPFKVFSHPSLEINRIDNDRIELRDKFSGSVKFVNLNCSDCEKDTLYPDMIIIVGAIDTMHYAHMFRPFKKLRGIKATFNVAFSVNEPLADVNNNGRIEYYCEYLGSSSILEYNKEDSTFNVAYMYSPFANYIYTSPRYFIDVDNDGLLETIVTAMNMKKDILALLILKQDDNFNFCKRVKSIYLDSATISRTAFPFYSMFNYDINGDSIYELILYSFYKHKLTILDYNKLIDNYLFVYESDSSYHDDVTSYLIGDFDKDGKINILTSGIMRGHVYIHEHLDDFNFNLKKIIDLSEGNLHLKCITKDLDNNGFDEIWIASSWFPYDRTRLYQFEAFGDDRYRLKYMIEINGDYRFFADAMRAYDIDQDGKEEILYITEHCFWIFKYLDNGRYDLYYFKIIDEWRQNYVFVNFFVKDIDFDGYPEIFFETMESPIFPYSNSNFFIKNLNEFNYNMYNPEITQVYKMNIQTSAHNNNLVNELKIGQNYPNPFNSMTNIAIELPEDMNIDIKVYNVLGEEVKTICSSFYKSGRYKIQWDGKDSQNKDLPSGIYLINFKSKTFSKTIKATIIR